MEEKHTFVNGGMIYFEKMRLLRNSYAAFKVLAPPTIQALLLQHNTHCVFLPRLHVTSIGSQHVIPSQ